MYAGAFAVLLHEPQPHNRVVHIPDIYIFAAVNNGGGGPSSRRAGSVFPALIAGCRLRVQPS